MDAKPLIFLPPHSPDALSGSDESQHFCKCDSESGGLSEAFVAVMTCPII